MNERTWVREVGRVTDIYGLFIFVGVDYGAVTIRTFSPVTLSAAQREQLDRLLYQADAEAAANIEALKALDEDGPVKAAAEAVTA